MHGEMTRYETTSTRKLIKKSVLKRRVRATTYEEKLEAAKAYNIEQERKREMKRAKHDAARKALA